MAESIKIEFGGRDELLASFQQLADSYYNYGYDALRKAGLTYRRKLRSRVWRAVVKHTGNLTKGLEVGQPQGFKGSDLSIEIAANGAKARHWHLIEEGHEIVRPYVGWWGKPLSDGGSSLGWWEGYHFFDQQSEASETDTLMEKEMVKALDKALKDGNL